MNLNTAITTVECSNEITITITITDKTTTTVTTTRYLLYLTIFVYADHAIDKQISSKR